MVSAKQIPKQQGIFNKVWELFKKYYDAPNTDETWQNFIDESNKLCHEAGNDTLAVKLCVAILAEKEDRVKKENGGK